MFPSGQRQRQSYIPHLAVPCDAEAKKFAELSAAIAAWLWKIFTVVYKVWIALALVVYFLILVALLIVVLVTASGR
jgi:hypothetical protein